MPVTPVLCCMHGIATPVVPSSQCRVPALWNSSLVVLDLKGNTTACLQNSPDFHKLLGRLSQ